MQNHLHINVTEPIVTLPKLLTIQVFYEALDQTIGVNSIRDAVKSGRIKSIQIGNRHLIPRAEVNDWLVRESESSLRELN